MAGIPIRGQPIGTPEQAYATARTRGAKRLDDTRAYFLALYRDAGAVGINADVLVAQWDVETGAGTSSYWVASLNPAGLAAFDDGSNWGLTFTPERAARVHVTHMARYAGVAVPREWQELDARWDAAAPYAGMVTTTADLGRGLWATDPDYGAKIDARYAAYWGAYEAMATHRYILSAGHRNTDGGGAWRGPESAWTYPICKKLKAAIERRGGKAWIISEEDGDSDPSFSAGRGLQNAARLCVDLASVVGGVDAYISMHYGAEPVDGFFVIYPDATGLSPASSVDVAANNPLDIRLGKAMVARVAKTGMPIRGDGLMSERNSGVGRQGYRLGEFYGTIGFRDRTARVIVEGGNSLDDAEYALLWSAAWQDKYVEALVDGLADTFGPFPTAPAPAPEPPKSQYAAASVIDELKDARPFLITKDGATLVRADLIVKTTKATPRLKYADASSERIGPDIGAGEEFGVDYIVLNPDGSRFWYTPWGTRVKYEDTTIVRAE